MKFIDVGRYELFESEYASEFIKQNCGGKATLIDKKTIKKFVCKFFKTKRVEIQYYGFPHSIDCRLGGLQLDIFQLYGEGAPFKPFETVNPFGVVSFWSVGAIAYAELLNNGEINITPIGDFE